MKNEYIGFLSKIKEIIKHTEIEFTYRMEYKGKVDAGQFFEVSIPKYGEAPISVSGIGEDYIDLTIRKVGKVTNEVFELKAGDKLFLRGPYGIGFNVNDYKNGNLLIVAGGTGVSPVKGVIDYFCQNREEVKDMTVIAGFKSSHEILFKEDFKKWSEKINTIITVDKLGEKESYKEGFVTEEVKTMKMEKPENIKAIVVGPPMMMKFTVKELLNRGLKEENIWISYERKMCCGLGKCGHCRIDDVYVCLDGPVFNYSKAKNLVD